MRNDLNKTFGEIFNDDISAFRNQLLEIQQFKADRRASEDWVRKLRFLDISDVPDLGEAGRDWRGFSKESHIIPVTSLDHDDGTIPYVAVSWRWTGRGKPPPSGCCTKTSFDYRIRRPGGKVYDMEFPNWYMERVIRFAQSRRITKVWIDNECIFQKKEDPPGDKQLGVQIMDVVYGDSAASVGILTTALTKQSELELLASLLDRSIFVDPEEDMNPRFKPGVKTMEIQFLILKILSDSRWSRGWIFQEDHLASAKMTLLIPHSPDIQKTPQAGFGDIDGELQVQVMAFRQAVTLFCLACPEDEDSWPLSEILGKAKQYNIWNRWRHRTARNPRNTHPVYLWYGSSNLNRRLADRVKLNTKNQYFKVDLYPTTALNILEDICNRSLENEQDRVAILANALKSSSRLDISDESKLVTSKRYSLSLALLTVVLMSGEIIRNDCLPSGTILDCTLLSYLHKLQFRFNAPNFRYQQSFIDRCRLRAPVITERGLETKGFLYRLLPHKKPAGRGAPSNPLSLDHNDREIVSILSQYPDISVWDGKTLPLPVSQILDILALKLARCWHGSRLADFLRRHIIIDSSGCETDSPAHKYVSEMMCAIYQALRDGRELRLARFAHEPNIPSVDPTAIFIEPPHGWGYEPDAMVFTSWDKGGQYHKETLTSLEVRIFDQNGPRKQWDPASETCHLKNYSWVNGLSAYVGEQMRTYVFPLAGIKEKPRPIVNVNKRKREEVADDGKDSVDDSDDDLNDFDLFS
jgi:hypothetical protein